MSIDHRKKVIPGDEFQALPQAEKAKREMSRSISLPASVVQALASHKRQQAEVRLKDGAVYQNYDLVFAALEGTPLMTHKHERTAIERAGSVSC